MLLISVGKEGIAPTQQGATTVHVFLDTHRLDWISSCPTMAPNVLVKIWLTIIQKKKKKLWSATKCKMHWQRTVIYIYSLSLCICKCSSHTAVRALKLCVWVWESCFLFHFAVVDEHAGGNCSLGLSLPSHLLFWVYTWDILQRLEKKSCTFDPNCCIKCSFRFPAVWHVAFNTVKKHVADLRVWIFKCVRCMQEWMFISLNQLWMQQVRLLTPHSLFVCSVTLVFTLLSVSFKKYLAKISMLFFLYLKTATSRLPQQIFLVLLNLSWTLHLLVSDIDECKSGQVCGPNSHCHNTNGSFYCTCQRDYIPMSGSKHFHPERGERCKGGYKDWIAHYNYTLTHNIHYHTRTGTYIQGHISSLISIFFHTQHWTSHFTLFFSLRSIMQYIK